jgi:hypothetical protein
MDSFYTGCPAKMEDGRLFNDFKSSTRRHEEIKYINGIKRDDKLRIMLQQNGAQIMKRIEDYNNSNLQCLPVNCVHDYPTRVSPSAFAEEMRRYNQRAIDVPQPAYDNNGFPRFNNQQSQNAKCLMFDNFKSSEY